jgi:hypothetical protein
VRSQRFAATAGTDQLEVTFREAIDHLCVESQWQWSDKAIVRTTPYPLEMFSVVALLGARLDRLGRIKVSVTAWYHKQRRILADTLAAVPHDIGSGQATDTFLILLKTTKVFSS